MSEKYNKILKIKIKVSFFLGCVLLVTGLGALLLLWYTPLPNGIGWVLAAALLISLYRQLCRHALRCDRRSIVGLELDTAGRGAVCYADATEWFACRVTESYVHPRVVILRLHAEAPVRRFSVVVAWDAVAAEVFRELRVCVNLLQYPADVEER